MVALTSNFRLFQTLFILHIFFSFLFVRNITKMEDAKVEIDDGKEKSLEPDTMYQ